MVNTKMSPKQLLMQRIGTYPFRRLLYSAIELWAKSETEKHQDNPKWQSVIERERKGLRHVIALLAPMDGKPYLDENIYPQYSETNTLALPEVCQNPNENLLKACKAAREKFRAMGDEGFELFLACNAAILEAEEVYL